jgi:2-amino-4-hydroxy-6-hydroxymethyldihydropteridine diphosphokinase
MTDVFVAAGSNIEPIKNLKLALVELERSEGSLRVSPAYRNKAVGFEGDDFVNLVVGFNTKDSLEQVRSRLQQIEADCGRPLDAPKWAPRSMDLDILLFGDEVRSEPGPSTSLRTGLVLPRPDLVKRPYMLKPICDIAPNLKHPTLHRTMRELWEAFEGKDHEMTVVELI